MESSGAHASVRPEGTIAMVNWTPGGFVWQMREATSLAKRSLKPERRLYRFRQRGSSRPGHPIRSDHRSRERARPSQLSCLADIEVEGAAAVVDSASYSTGTVTPNGIPTYFGPVGCLPNDQIMVDGQAAAVLFSNATQINFVVPESIVGDPATIVLQRQPHGSILSIGSGPKPIPFYPDRNGEGPGKHC